MCVYILFFHHVNLNPSSHISFSMEQDMTILHHVNIFLFVKSPDEMIYIYILYYDCTYLVNYMWGRMSADWANQLFLHQGGCWVSLLQIYMFWHTNYFIIFVFFLNKLTFLCFNERLLESIQVGMIQELEDPWSEGGWPCGTYIRHGNFQQCFPTTRLIELCIIEYMEKKVLFQTQRYDFFYEKLYIHLCLCLYYGDCVLRGSLAKTCWARRHFPSPLSFMGTSAFRGAGEERKRVSQRCSVLCGQEYLGF